jgi:hypothetical protein
MLEKPISIWLALHPDASLTNETLVARFLEVLESSTKFIPATWGLFERDRDPFDRAKVLATTKEPEESFFLFRDKAIKYNAQISLRPHAFRFVSVNFHTSLSSATWPKVEEFSDLVASAMQAQFGVLHIYRPGQSKWTNDEEKTERWMEMAAQPYPSVFHDCGPPGLGMRTYFGGEILNLWGKELLSQVKAEFRELPWGGVRLDLAKDLWNLSRSEAARLAKQAVDSLASAEAFAEPVFHWDGRTVDFEPSMAWKRFRTQRSTQT